MNREEGGISLSNHLKLNASEGFTEGMTAVVILPCLNGFIGQSYTITDSYLASVRQSEGSNDT